MRSRVRSSPATAAISAFSASSATATLAAGAGVGLSIVAAGTAVSGAARSSPQAPMSMPARQSNTPRYDRASSQAVGASASEVR